jgi:CRISPR-associated protein Cst2
MSLHIFANIVTPFGTAANNRGETEGNVTTLQKLLWLGDTHTTVSAEAIRFALRRLLATLETTNRSWSEEGRRNQWVDGEFSAWADPANKAYIDDDLLGYMSAKAAAEEAEDGAEQSEPNEKSKTGKASSERKKGKALVRRAVLEITRAVSLTPWVGDTTFNAASPGATPSASKGDNEGKRDKNPVPYGTEVHATRYQYGFALTPERLRDKSRAAKAVKALCELGTVAGNHGRFLFDFSPDAVVFRVTDDPAPRLLYCFDTADAGKTVTAASLLKRIDAGDVKADELVVGVGDLDSQLAAAFKEEKVAVSGVKAAAEEAVKRINSHPGIKG